jgi:hypothetical protein
MRQNGGRTAAKTRPTDGGSAAGTRPVLVLDFRSFLMKADLGKAGLIPLILRWQQQSQNRCCQAISRRRRNHSTQKRLLATESIGNSRVAIAVPGRPSAFKMASAVVSSTRAERTGSASIPPQEPSAPGRPSTRRKGFPTADTVPEFFEHKSCVF